MYSFVLAACNFMHILIPVLYILTAEIRGEAGEHA